MVHWTGLLSTLGKVAPFDYPYVTEQRSRPDPLPKLIEAHRAALAGARHAHRGPVVLIGKSMGGRVGCHLSLEDSVAAVVCLGYPLCGGGDCTKLRDKVLRELRAPVLFVQGTRDSLCPLEVLAGVRRAMTSPNELYVVEGGDHSLIVAKGILKAHGASQDAVDQAILRAIGEFVARHASRNG
jgi:predicted alpha/beta-hydrolase family hydrolase